MNASATTPVAEQAILRDPLRILTSKLPQLKAVWEKVDQSGFEPASKNHQLALLRRAFFQEFTAQASVPVLPENQTLPQNIRQMPLHLQALQKASNRLWKGHLPTLSTTTMLSMRPG